MISLDENKSKELAKVIGNDTSRKILDYLGGQEDVSEAVLAKELGIPVSTVHYNVKHLLGSGLIESKEFKWSEKGKKIDLYNVARKLIIIAPKGTESVREKLKSFLPITLGAFFVSGALYIWQKVRVVDLVNSVQKAAPMMMDAAVEESAVFGASPLGGGEQALLSAAPGVIRDGVTSFTPIELNYALWFLIGSMFTIVIMFLYSYWKMKNFK